MRTVAIVTVLSTVLAVAATACGKSPTGPSSLGLSVEVIGPGTVAPGETVQFGLIAHMTDGTSRDVTKEASWRAMSPAGLSDVSIDGSGLVTGVKLGQARIQGTYGNTTGSKDVIVVPTGTFRLVGKVFEVDDPSQPVIDALVEATTATGATLVASTDRTGFYALYGVVGATILRVSREGFEGLVQTINVTAHQTINLTLKLSTPRPNVSGTYTLTISAADECGVGLGEGRLPDEARVRKYPAVVTQTGPALKIDLSGAALLGDPSDPTGRLYGKLEPGRALFKLYIWSPWDSNSDVIAEQLTTGIFEPVGTVVAAISNEGLAGTLDGSLMVVVSGSPRIARCSSPQHRFVLSR
jgi:hypothetical protein